MIQTADDLVTSSDKIRAGYIKLALEKNYLSYPYIEEAKTLKCLLKLGRKPKELKGIKDIVFDLNVIEEDFIDELVYRYLLTKGDALGGKARNLAGVLGERKFLRSFISVFNLAGINYQWKDRETNSWLPKPQDDVGIENRICGLYWQKGNKNRILLMNINVPIVKKNVDLSIFQGNIDELKKGSLSIIHNHSKYIALGELKGGIDPAGADEHWKTANSALDRIRNSFMQMKLQPKTFFIGAAIENSMASEMFEQLQNGTMSNAANLTVDKQLTTICNWILNL